MSVVDSDHIDLLRLAARQLTGHQHRVFLAEVTLRVCEGKPRQAGWGRETVRKGLEELRTGTSIVDNFAARGRARFEDRCPQLADDIRDIVEPKTQADPELKSTRRYTNLSAAELRQTLIDQKGWSEAELPAERTLRDILNRMNYRLKRIQKGRPLKKRKDTDAVFENIQAVRAAARDDPETLEMSADTKAKVAIGDYSRGGKNTNGCGRKSCESVGP